MTEKTERTSSNHGVQGQISEVTTRVLNPFESAKSSENEVKTPSEDHLAAINEGEPKNEALPDNPEVGERLTNLSCRHACTRPEWFSFDPLRLEGRTRQCRQIFWHILEAHRENRNRKIALLAPNGMGKTAFLAELYDMLEHARESVMTLSPCQPEKKSFQALRHLLEQRFYVSSDASYECMSNYVSGAVRSLMEGHEAEKVIRGVMQLWESRRPALPSLPNAKSVHASQPKIREMDAKEPSDEEDTMRFVASSGAQSTISTDALLEALVHLFKADMARNAFVIVFDDVDRFDAASLEILGKLEERLETGRLTILMTARTLEDIPDSLRDRVEPIELQALSDHDLGTLTQYLLRKLSEKREKLIVPRDMCHLIAQRAYGSPKRAIELTLHHFAPEHMVQWNEAIETLRREPVPQELAHRLLRRFRETEDAERLILQFASHLNAPFTSSTIECILSTWNGYAMSDGMSCAKILKKLRNQGFFEHADESFGDNAPTYVFKHECERMLIVASVNAEMQHHVYRAAAQWYSLNNADGAYDEVIGDLWRNEGHCQVACRYYESAAYRDLEHAQFSRAWGRFRKLLGLLQEEDIASRVRIALDSAHVAFSLGQVDEAFRLCRQASHHASQICAWTQAARACIQLANMLVDIGCLRHVRRYTARANFLLNREGDPVLKTHLYLVLARHAALMAKNDMARRFLDKAQNCCPKSCLREQGLLEWNRAELESEFGNPAAALDVLKSLLEKEANDEAMCAKFYHAIGKIYAGMGNISLALENWNIALGRVQEMHDEILHAKLLADISDGALQLDARKTARSTTEQCLGMAQQTHQKNLISRCLANTAYLQFESGQVTKAMRTARKAHKGATALNDVRIWSKTLALLTRIQLHPDCAQIDIEHAIGIYQKIDNIYARRGMALFELQHLMRFIGLLRDQKRGLAAMNACRLAKSIAQKLELDRMVERIAEIFDRLSLKNERV